MGKPACLVPGKRMNQGPTKDDFFYVSWKYMDLTLA
jgi:hypothetical protein